MDATPRVDAGLSHPLARPTLLFGLLMVVFAVQVSNRLPAGAGGVAVWIAAGVIALDFTLVTVRKPGRLARWQVALVAGLSLAAVMLLLTQADSGALGRV